MTWPLHPPRSDFRHTEWDKVGRAKSCPFTSIHASDSGVSWPRYGATVHCAAAVGSDICRVCRVRLASRSQSVHVPTWPGLRRIPAFSAPPEHERRKNAMHTLNRDLRLYFDPPGLAGCRAGWYAVGVVRPGVLGEEGGSEWPDVVERRAPVGLLVLSPETLPR